MTAHEKTLALEWQELLYYLAVLDEMDEKDGSDGETYGIYRCLLARAIVC